MKMFDLETAPTGFRGVPIPVAELDHALTAQFIVALAGETNEAGANTRLGWWKSDFVSEFGGEDLFKRLLPATWQWAVLQGAREAARRKDEELRRQDYDADRIISLFNFGFELDERVEERLLDLKRSGLSPQTALSGLTVGLETSFDRSRFATWVQSHGKAETAAVPIGRRLKGDPPISLDETVRHLVAALAPLSAHYPLPHFRRTA